MLYLRLFGGAVLESDLGRVSGRGAQRHQIALLALLATAPGHTLSRDKLIGLLWPESDTKRARNLLSVAVYGVRRTLGEDVLLSTGDGVTLNGDRCRVDVAEFESALTARQLERAVRCYKGPFLDGFFLDEAREFDRWVEAERDRLARRYAGAVRDLAVGAEAAGQPACAAEWWRQLVAHDPYDSQVALGLVRALARAGNRAGALRHAQGHESLLRTDLGIEPSREIATFAATLGGEQVDAVATPSIRAATPPLTVLTPVAPAPRPVAGPSASTHHVLRPPERHAGLRRAVRVAMLIVLPVLLVGYAAVTGRQGARDAAPGTAARA
ncbi:MAG: winged helix-turn-helix domain-containing protein, partial [Gemmatimonadota bacterium]|nr:winged helix-turn-helix domain-containing protein [Gemmatimonadota bacterium]